MENIVLYRGDYEKIKTFDVSKTNKRCLMGRGIYLTDDIKLAETYRTKGAGFGMTDVYTKLAHGKFDTKGAAIEVGLNNFCALRWEETRGTAWATVKAKEKSMFRLGCLSEWDRLRDLGKITIETEKVRDYKLSGSKMRAAVLEQYINIRYRHSDRVVGRISKFQFDNTGGKFMDRIVNVGKIITDKKVIECISMVPRFNPFNTPPDEYCQQFNNLVVDLNIPFYIGFNPVNHIYRRYAVARELSAKEKNMIASSQKKNVSVSYGILSRLLSERGYIGFAYPGGAITNGSKHNAFSLWDDTFVNEHFVERMC